MPKQTKKPAAKKKPAKRDVAQTALSVVERAIGGTLKPRGRK